MIKCLSCKLCLDLETTENPTKKTPITECCCELGKWDGPDYIGEDLSDWKWNDCKSYKCV